MNFQQMIFKEIIQQINKNINRIISVERFIWFLSLINLQEITIEMWNRWFRIDDFGKEIIQPIKKKNRGYLPIKIFIDLCHKILQEITQPINIWNTIIYDFCWQINHTTTPLQQLYLISVKKFYCLNFSYWVNQQNFLLILLIFKEN